MVLGFVLTLVIGCALFSRMTAYLPPVFLIITLVWRFVLYRIDARKASASAE